MHNLSSRDIIFDNIFVVNFYLFFLVIFYNSSICSNVRLYWGSCANGCLSVQWSVG